VSLLLAKHAHDVMNELILLVGLHHSAPAHISNTFRNSSTFASSYSHPASIGGAAAWAG